MRYPGIFVGLVLASQFLVTASAVGSAAVDPGAPVIGPMDVPKAPKLPELPDVETIGGAKTPGSSPTPNGPAGPTPGFDALFTGATFESFALVGLAASTLAAFAIIGGAKYVNSQNVLENEVRGEIYGFLRKSVGANLKQITDELALSTTNAVWHLRKLEQSGLVRSRKFNGYKIYYPVEGGVRARDLSCSASTLSNDNARTVFEFVAANPGSHQREIARVLGVNHGTVRWHLKKLRQAGLLVEMRNGKVSTYFPTDIGKEAFDIAVRNSAPRYHVEGLASTL